METLQIVLIGAGILALAWFLLKFGRALVILALVAGVIVVAVVLALALLPGEPVARPAAETVRNPLDTIEDVGQTMDNVRQTTGNVERATDSIGRTAEKVERAAAGFFRDLVFGILTVALLVALGAVGFLAVKVKLLERGTLLPKLKRRERLPDAGRVVYIVKASDESEPVWEVNEWLSDDWQL